MNQSPNTQFQLIVQGWLRGRSHNTNIHIAGFLESSSPLVLHAAGALGQQQSLEEDALQYFLFAFSQIEDTSYSFSYYYRSYYRFHLSSDLVPQMWPGRLTTEMADSFLLLAEQFAKNGDPDKALEIRDRINIEAELAPRFRMLKERKIR